MMCDDIELVRYLPPNATQEQIDAIAQDMANIAAIHFAVCSGQRTDPTYLWVENDAFEFMCEDGVPVSVPAKQVRVPVDDASLPLSYYKQLANAKALERVVCFTAFVPPGACANAGPYSATIQATGGKLPYTFAITAGGLPPGLSLTASTGLIHGSPTTGGNYTFTITVTDDNGTTHAKSFSIRVVEITGTLPTIALNVPFTYVLTQAGGVGPFSWYIGPGTILPAGLHLNGVTGVIIGTPQDTLEYVFDLYLVTPTRTCGRTFHWQAVVPTPPGLSITGLDDFLDQYDSGRKAGPMAWLPLSGSYSGWTQGGVSAPESEACIFNPITGIWQLRVQFAQISIIVYEHFVFGLAPAGTYNFVRFDGPLGVNYPSSVTVNDI